jgi:hypothetical protein
MAYGHGIISRAPYAVRCHATRAVPASLPFHPSHVSGRDAVPNHDAHHNRRRGGDGTAVDCLLAGD